MSERKRLIPLPGAVDGRGGWTVRDAGSDGAAQTHLQRKRMQVPTSATEETRQVQLHELAHVAFSEADPAAIARRSGASLAFIEGAEDARLTALLANLGLPQDAELLPKATTENEVAERYSEALAAYTRADRTKAGEYEKKRLALMEVTEQVNNLPREATQLARAAKANDPAVALLLASYGTGDGATVRDAVARYNPNGEALSSFVDAIVAEHLDADNPTDPEWTVRLAQAVREALDAATAEGGKGDEEGDEDGEGKAGGEDGDGADGDASGISDAELDAMFAASTTRSAKPSPTSATAGTSGSPLSSGTTLTATGRGSLASARTLMQSRANPAQRNGEAIETDTTGAAIGSGAASTDGTARTAPSVATPPPPVPKHREDEVRRSMERPHLGGTPERLAGLESLAVARRHPSGAGGKSIVGFGADGRELVGYGRWGSFDPEYDTLHPKLRVRQGRAFLPKGKRRGTDAGSVPTGMHRLAIDGRVFRGPKLKDGNAGAVLIDVSGSMSLTLAQVKTILSVMPASIVACYSGDPNHMAILARRGMMVDDTALGQTLRQMGGNNAIDGPALDWLAKQRGPRFWISDGGITGDSDSGVSEAMRAQVIQTCLRSRILRVGSVREVVSRFGREKRVAA